MKNVLFSVAISLVLVGGTSYLLAEDVVTPPKPEAKPDPTGANTGGRAILGIDDPKIEDVPIDPKSPSARDEAQNKLKKFTTETVMDAIGKNRAAINMMWTLLTGFLVFFMQAGFAMVETGLTRAKNVTHTMAMNLMVYAIGVLGFWICGYALMMGNYGAFSNLDGPELLTKEYTITLMGKPFGLFGHEGFFLSGKAFDSGLMALFLFQMVFMDTAVTIPTGAMAERWKFFAFVIYGFFMSMIIYPIYGNWVWGNGWLAKLGANFGLGHGHVDFAGSSVVHMVGGVTALAGVLVLGARLGKYNKNGTPNAIPAHNVPMYVVGTFILAFGWFGFNPGSTLAGTDLNIGRIATNTMLASAAGAFVSMCYMWAVYQKPDPSFMCNGLLAGLVAITAPCAFVSPAVAVLIGAIAGLLVIWGCFFIERVLKVDDPVGAIGVHGINGMWGVLALGLFADGTYGQGLNGSFWYKLADGSLKWEAEKLKEIPEGVIEQGVTGLFYGNPSQLVAEFIGVGANLVWVFATAYAFFWVVEKLIGNRVSPAIELQGLDVHEMGVLGYINEDPKASEGTEIPRSAGSHAVPVSPGGKKRFTVVVEGVDSDTLAHAWSGLCQTGDAPPSPDFLALYPHMTTFNGNRFNFRQGEPEVLRATLERLLKAHCNGTPLRTRVETPA